MDHMIGQALGHYRIDAKLGEGGMGVVYRAFDTHLDRPVAIKVLPPEAVANPERKRRFVQEAKAASALNHPNIIHIYDIDTAVSPQGATDFIAFFNPSKPESQRTLGMAKWEDVMRIAGDLFLDTQMFPARFYVSKFPTEDQLAAVVREQRL